MLTQGQTQIQVEQMLILQRTNSFCRLPSYKNIHPSTCQQIETLMKLKPPANIKEVWHFLGLTGYYQKFIYSYADIMHT